MNDDGDMLTEMLSVETSAEIADTAGISSNNWHVENSSTDDATFTSASATPGYPQQVRKKTDAFHPSY